MPSVLLPSTAVSEPALTRRCPPPCAQASSVRMDLRFVPDEVDFSDRKARDTATELPAGYAPLDFSSSAFQHTRVKLTWDQDDPVRRCSLR